MKRCAFCCALLVVCLCFFAALEARETGRTGLRPSRAVVEGENQLDIDLQAELPRSAAAVDTYCLVWYDFEQMNWQGWTRIDNTAQIAAFFHVDDFAGLGGGSFGGLVPLEGTKSMWCGTRHASDPRAAAPFTYICSWEEAPGYGNAWDQLLTTDAFGFTGPVTFSYTGCFNSEQGYDRTSVEYDSGHDNWVELARYDGAVSVDTSHTILLSQVSTKLRFHFTSDGEWSDEDGLYDTDGGAIVDGIGISDIAGQINYEDWEGEAPDATQSTDGFWIAEGMDGFGSFCKLANNLVFDGDPCERNHGTQVVFWDEPGIYPEPGYPVTPFCRGAGGISAPCQNESFVSPVIEFDMYSSNRDENQNMPIPPEELPTLGGTVLRFGAMIDLPLDNLVFFRYAIREIIDGCPGEWHNPNMHYYYWDSGYIQFSWDVSHLVGANPLQVSLGVVDMCDQWFDEYGDCAEHTSSPWVDNVRVYRYETACPQWSYRDIDLFQDNFPGEEFDIESWSRADMANDLRPNDDSVIDPGDSAVVTCTAPMAGGLDTLSTGEERVYCYVYAEYIGEDGLKSDIHGATLQGTYGTWIQTIGDWDEFLCPTAVTGAGNEADDIYMIDLNDSLLTRGYEIKYYFKAWDLDGNCSTIPETAEETGGDIFEFTILPTYNTDILFVDDYSGIGSFAGTVQTYWDACFPADDMPDRYDVNGPSSLASNGPGSRAYTYQMVNGYETIVWDSGDLRYGTITEGTDYSDKSNDAQMLIDWMDCSEHKVGLMVMGDNIAQNLDGSTAASALELLSTKCGVTLVNESYYELTGGNLSGGVVTPEITGVGIYEDLTYYAFGGCPVINGFDVMGKTGENAAFSLQLPDFGGADYYIGISNSQLNDAAYPMRTSFIGNSMQVVRSIGIGAPKRDFLIHLTMRFFEEDYYYSDADEPMPLSYALLQNHPNPFNPSTTIKFDLPEKANVSLRIYNVAGQLVRTLAGGGFDAGRHSLRWDGHNEAGTAVASGVYFYKLETPSFRSTRKMVLLK